MKENIRQTKECPTNQYYNYVTRDDLLDIFGNDVVLTVKNFDSQTFGPAQEQTLRHYSVRFRSIFKRIDARLVTNAVDDNRSNASTSCTTTTTTTTTTAAANAVIENGDHNNGNSNENDIDMSIDSSKGHNHIDDDGSSGSAAASSSTRPIRIKQKLGNDTRRPDDNHSNNDHMDMDDNDRRDAAKTLLHFALKKSNSDQAHSHNGMIILFIDYIHLKYLFIFLFFNLVQTILVGGTTFWITMMMTSNNHAKTCHCYKSIHHHQAHIYIHYIKQKAFVIYSICALINNFWIKKNHQEKRNL